MNLENIIYIFRGQRVILDRDIAKLYGVSTKRLNEQVRRNSYRFPEDFAFRLNRIELENWRSQIATSNPELKMGLRRPPLAFTEYGTVMLANVLRSKHATSPFFNRDLLKKLEISFVHLAHSSKFQCFFSSTSAKNRKLFLLWLRIANLATYLVSPAGIEPASKV
ncbi:hypothetical protein GF354_06360 [Candidatus Peregrinibacteria bacterium]|nr:hypothetical protein [Candidatus Peregrinibacteria bacterium]